jgi:DNA polymerase-3 subunit beta
MVFVSLAGNDECILTGRAREFGEAVENIPCKMDGDPMFIGFNTRFFFDAVKALEGSGARLIFNGRYGHMLVKSQSSDNFFCLVAPVEMSNEEMEMSGENSGVDVL